MLIVITRKVYYQEKKKWRRNKGGWSVIFTMYWTPWGIWGSMFNVRAGEWN